MVVASLSTNVGVYFRAIIGQCDEVCIALGRMRVSPSQIEELQGWTFTCLLAPTHFTPHLHVRGI
jgi:hypothetical protein